MTLSYEAKFILYPRLFWASHLAFISALVLWFSPFTYPLCQRLDEFVFQVFNSSLIVIDNSFWQYFWGMLNHRQEVKLNLLIAALFNIWAILATKERNLRNIRIKQTLYFWICFQIGFMLQHHLFNTLLHIERYSPSLVLEPVAKLSLLLQNPDIKDASYHSFPGAHAFAMIYWASFTLLCAPKSIARMGMLSAVTLSLARLFSGAHWFSDVVFSALLALVWLSWTTQIPLYHAMIMTKQANPLPNT